MAMTEFQALVAGVAILGRILSRRQTLEKLERVSDARGFYREGIAKTRDEHARSEMQAALGWLGSG